VGFDTSLAPPHPSRILIVAPSWIGDTLMAQPLFMGLKARHPGCSIDALAPAWVVPVLERMAQIRRVIANPFAHGELNLAARRALGRRLRDEGYDLALVLPNSWKSALVPFFAGIPRRVGYRGEMRYGLLNDLRRLDEAAVPRLVDRYALLAEPPGAHPSASLPLPRLEQRPGSRVATLAALRLAVRPAPVVFCPGAEYGPAKRWPAAHFAALARRLARDGHPVWLVGSAKDAAVGAEIAAAAGGACRNLCGATSLDQAIDLLTAARLVVSNDSGLMHVAAALDRPLVALYGSSSPDYTPPLSPRAVVLRTGIECSPCFERTCPLGHFRCLNDLTADLVYARVTTLLGQAADLGNA
jgi:heptosyltransferase-2